MAADQFSELPPSALLVYKVLEYEAPLTQIGLVEETRLVARTVRYALDRLERHNLVESEPYMADARQSLYSVANTTEADVEGVAG